MSKVTIITSIFEANEFMQPFLDDIERQTIFEDCTLYLVCCNKSTSHPDNIACHNFVGSPTRRRGKVEFHQIKDPGIYGVWNWVIEHSDSPYITNANVDDRLHPKCIEKHVQLLEEKPEIDLAYCYNICSTIKNETIETTKGKNRYPTSKFFPKRMLRGNLPHNHPVWRRELHEKFGLFDESIFSAADWEFWLRCVAGGAQFELIPENLGLYYLNPKGISTNRITLIKKMVTENGIRRKYQKLIR